MNIKEIYLENFKNIKKSKIEFKNNLSGIYGPNGVGKTAIIEAVEIIKLYFSNSNNNILDIIKNLIKINENNMKIEIILIDDKFEYKIAIKFIKNLDNGLIYVAKEEISYKEVKTRKKYIEIARIENEEEFLLPKVYLGKEKLESKEFFKNIKIPTYKTLIHKFNNMSSFFFNLLEETVDTELKEIKIINNAFALIKNIMFLKLEDQNLYKTELTIPINCILKNNVIHLEYSNKNNTYTKQEAELLKDTAKNINDLISIIIPDSKFLLEEKSGPVNKNNEETVSLNLYIEKNNIKVPILWESTGTIKLISLLSILISYIKNEKVTILIDELDVHIFEYLLAILLKEMSREAKGQLIFTGHNLLPMEKLGKDSIIIATKLEGEINYTYMKGISHSTNIRQKYLKSQALWSEENIEPLLLNIPALKVFIKGLVIENEN